MNTVNTVFTVSDNHLEIAEISINETTVPGSDILGFCFPVYAFGIPRICRKYLNGISGFSKRQNAFIIITAGDSDETGFAMRECERILAKKNCEIVYSGIVQMPINWTTSPKPPFPPSKEEAIEIIEKGVVQARGMANDILNGKRKYHVFNYPKRYSIVKFYREYLSFKYLGIQNMWRLFKVYDTCNGCKLCAKICPTNSIRIVDKKPVWSKTCEQCMRCVNFCPTESIYQSQGGGTKGKNKYHEPGFKPKQNAIGANTEY
jgi:ferredoxin